MICSSTNLRSLSIGNLWWLNIFVRYAEQCLYQGIWIYVIQAVRRKLRLIRIEGTTPLDVKINRIRCYVISSRRRMCEVL
jgi:hypothetical protein